jgi:hypothetical protein
LVFLLQCLCRRNRLKVTSVSNAVCHF